MDNIDQKILEILYKNSRTSAKDIAETVGLSAPATADRIKRLEESGVITGYTIKIDPAKIGKVVKAVINVSMRVNKQPEFIRMAKTNPAIIACHHITGTYSMIVKVMVRDVLSLEKLIETIQEYGDTQTQIVLSSAFDEGVNID